MKKKRVWALLLAIMMVVSVMPVSAFARDEKVWYVTAGNSVELIGEGENGIAGTHTWRSHDTNKLTVVGTGNTATAEADKDADGYVRVTHMYKTWRYSLRWGYYQTDVTEMHWVYISKKAGSGSGSGSGGTTQNAGFGWQQAQTGSDGKQDSKFENDADLLGKVHVYYFLNGVKTELSRGQSSNIWSTVTSTGIVIEADAGYKITGISMRCNHDSGQNCQTYKSHTENMTTSYPVTVRSLTLTGDDVANLWARHYEAGKSNGQGAPYWLCVSIATAGYDLSYTFEGEIPGDAEVPDGVADKAAGDKVTLAAAPTTSETGYRFDGWYYQNGTDSEGNPVKVKAEPGIPFTMPNHDVVMTGIWSVAHTVTYDANEPEGAPAATGATVDDNTYFAGDNVPVKENGFVISGYTFTGWNTRADGKGEDIGKTFEMPAQDVTLYAQWEKKSDPAPATVDLNGTSEAGLINKKFIDNAVKQGVPFPNGYVFTVTVTEVVEEGKTAKVYTGKVNMSDAGTEAFDFGDDRILTFDKAGTYCYEVKEIEIDTYSEIDYDDSVYTMTVVVTENTDDNQLEASVTFEKQSPAQSVTPVSTDDSTTVTFTNTRGAQEPVLPPQPKLSVTKTVLDILDTENNGGYDVAHEGDTVQWKIVVKNTGTASGNFSLTDILKRDGVEIDGVEIYATDANGDKTGDALPSVTGTLAAGASATYIAEYKVTRDDLGSELSNTAKVGNSGSTPDPVEVAEGEPALSVTKTVLDILDTNENSSDVAREGYTVQWGITVSNTGNAEGTYTLVDTLTLVSPVDKTTEESRSATIFKATLTTSPAVDADGNTIRDGEGNEIVVTEWRKVEPAQELSEADLTDVKLADDASDYYIAEYTVTAEDVKKCGGYSIHNVASIDGKPVQPETDPTIVPTPVEFDPNNPSGATEGTEKYALVNKNFAKTDGSDPLPGNFNATFTATIADESNKSINGCVTMTKEDEASFKFTETLTFSEAGAYKFTIAETVGKNGCVGYDDTTYTLTITVELNEDGTAYEVKGWTVVANEKEAVPQENAPVTFHNTYTAYTVTYTDGVEGVEVFADQVYSGLASGTDTPAFNGTPTREGYTFAGWNPEVAETVTKTITYVAQWKRNSTPITPVGPSKDNKPELNTEDHYAYIVGMPDGLVHPEQNITRAEVATIFFRMLLDESRDYWWCQTNSFADVAGDAWYNNAISTLTNAGLLNGYPNGNFGPNDNITRAEFAAIAVRFFTDEAEEIEITGDAFPDIAKSWANYEINLAYALDLVQGTGEGTFEPDRQITRAEAMTIVNRVLKRAPHKDQLLDDMIEWPDNMNTGAWYYAAVQEATNSHKYYLDDDGFEVWTELEEVRDWVALEKEWSNAHSSSNPGEVVSKGTETPEPGNDGKLTVN